MRLKGHGLLVAMMVAAISAIGCAKTEQPGGGASTTPSAPVATPDPHPPIGILDTPGEGATVANKSWGTGWALDDSGILQVTATEDNGVVSPALIGQPFHGVKEAYPNLPDNDRAGFIFGIDLPPGPHTLKIEIVAKDGGKTVLTRSFNVQ